MTLQSGRQKMLGMIMPTKALTDEKKEHIILEEKWWRLCACHTMFSRGGSTRLYFGCFREGCNIEKPDKSAYWF
jgi:hypothetical protein